MEPFPSEVSSPLQPLQALGDAVSASLACAEEMVPQRMLRRTSQAETGADVQKSPEHRAIIARALTKFFKRVIFRQNRLSSASLPFLSWGQSQRWQA